MPAPFDKHHHCSRTKEYKAWCATIQRCTNPNHVSYRNYGARGITICPHWRYSYTQFLSDMGPKPEKLTLERKNNDLGYLCPLCCPPIGNCEWADRRKQLANRRPISWKPEKTYTVKGEAQRAFWANQTEEYKRARCAPGAVGASERLAKWRANKNTECLHCGHRWAKTKQGRPTMCPKCHTSKWDVPLAQPASSMPL